MGISRTVEIRRFINLSVFTPRIWKLMIAGAYPILLVCADYFEALERTGRAGAFIADTIFPALLVGYAVLAYLLKKREL